MNAPSRLTLTHTGKVRDDEAAERPLEFGLIRRLVAYTRPLAARRNTLMALVLLRAVQLPCMAWATGAVINGPIARGDWRGTLLGALGFGLLAALTQFTLVYRQRLALQLGEAAVHDLRRDVFRHLLAMPMSFYSRTRLGRIISRMTSDIEAVRIGVQNVLFVSTVQIGQMLVAALLMLALDPALFLIVAALAPVLWGLNRVFRRRFSRLSRATQESFSRVTSTLAESVSGIRVTQGFVREDVNADLFRELVADHSRYNVEMARTSGVFLPLLDFTSQVFIAALLVVGGLRALDPALATPLGNLIQFVFLAGIFFSPLQSLGTLYHQALAAMAGAERVFKLLDTPPEWTDALDAVDLPALRGRVELRRVTFGYDPARPVLHDLSLTAEPGEIIALVGHTGSGKTSIINLIAKFYLPTQGEVLIDDVPIRAIRSDSLHRQMAIIQQQNFLFAGTVMDNIRVGRPTATDAEVAEAARRLDCLDLLEALPDGLQSEVGERGAGLSLGQRQLVCFVRAMLADPRILILDEATSSVDTMTEARIQRALQVLLKGRTCFVIAHRLSTIRDATRVLVLNQGRVIERGTHLDLLAAGGVYTNLYRQFVRATAPDSDDDPAVAT
jgi:ATP-binding cassette subfamily B protein